MIKRLPHRLLILLVLTPCHHARAQKPPLHFEVVSVRESQPNPDGSYNMRYDSDPHTSHLEIVNLTQDELIQRAFALRTFQIEGMAQHPRIIYTIRASSGEDTDAILKAMTDEQAAATKRRMVQEILVERFHLKYHFVTRDMPSYLLAVGKEPKLTPSSVKPPAPGVVARKDDPTTPWITWRCGHPGCSIEARGQTMENLAQIFVGYLDAPIADRTNLPGLWDFNLQWWAPMMSSSGNPADDSYPQPPDAFAQQLGLKLERGKAPIQILVVDHIEPPTAN